MMWPLYLKSLSVYTELTYNLSYIPYYFQRDGIIWCDSYHCTFHFLFYRAMITVWWKILLINTECPLLQKRQRRYNLTLKNCTKMALFDKRVILPRGNDSLCKENQENGTFLAKKKKKKKKILKREANSSPGTLH